MAEERLLGGPCSVCGRYGKDIDFGNDAWWPLNYGADGHCLICPECSRKLYASLPEAVWRKDFGGTLRRVIAPYLSKEPKPEPDNGSGTWPW